MFPDITRDDIFRLETEHLWLRWLRASDAPVVTAFAGVEAVARMTASIPHPYPPGEAERFILGARAATAAGEALILAVTLKNKGQSLVGLVSAQASESHDVEIGYVIAPTAAGRGFATEATTTLIDAVFNLTETRVITSNSRVINPASRRVLEKCGLAFAETGLKNLPARGGQHPCDFFTLDRHRWRSHAKRHRMPAMAHQQPRDPPKTTDEHAQ